MTSLPHLGLDHVLNTDHDALVHSSVFSASEGNLFCVHCASERYMSAPDFRRLALLDGISSILRVHGPQCLHDSVAACLSMLLHGIDSADPGLVQAATDIFLTLKGELPDPVGTLTSLVSRTISLGIPRASGHLFLVGQLLTNASHDRTLATTLGIFCTELGSTAEGSCFTNDGRMEDFGQEALREFPSFLAAHAVSVSCPDHIKSDVMYVAMELLDCCKVATRDLSRVSQAPEHPPQMSAQSSISSPIDDPFVRIMLDVPRLLARRSSCDEALQLHSIAYLATASAYCRQRTDAGWQRWSTNAAGVPEVLAGLFDGSRNGDNSAISSHEKATTGNSVQLSSGGLPSTIKTLLMSSSYRVRSATAQLIATLCSDKLPTEPEAQENVIYGVRGGGCFFRETLLAAGTADFLFEAIKTEREGTTRHYLEAAEAFSLSPVEFFHARNFSMKFAAPVLLGASRGAGADCASAGWSKHHGPSERCKDEDEAKVFDLSCRLLLQALVTVPASSSISVVEELISWAAASVQSDSASKNRAIGTAADVLSLIKSGDIPLPKDQTKFIDAVAILLDSLEENLLRATCSEYPEVDLPSHPGGGPLPSGSSNLLNLNVLPGQDRHGDGHLIYQATRVLESLLHLVEDWSSLQGCPQSSSKAGRRSAVDDARGIKGHKGSSDFQELVFGVYERTLRCQYNVVTMSGCLSHSLAFVSCMGTAIDAASAILNKQWMESVNNGVYPASFHIPYVKPSFLGAQELANLVQNCQGSIRLSDDGGNSGDCSVVNTAGSDLAGASHNVKFGDTTDTSVTSPASCLETTLRTILEADVVSWLLNVYKQCEGSMTPSAGEHLYHTDYGNVQDAVAEVVSSQLSEGSDDYEICCATTRDLIAEVLQSLLYTQGWANGLCSLGADGHSQMSQRNVGKGGHERHCESMGGSMLGSEFKKTVRFVLQSWTTRSEDSAELMPLDQYVISQLGTSEDNGDLCKLAVILVSLSPLYLGLLHPHSGCRVDSAVALLQYAKAPSEAVFCLNLFSHVLLANAKRGKGYSACSSQIDGNLVAAITNVLCRFPMADIASSLIPVSASTLSFILRAGCLSFMADWLVFVPLDRIKVVLKELGASGRQQRADDTSGISKSSEREAFCSGKYERATNIPVYTCDEEALTGILKAIVSRWKSEVGGGPWHHRGEVTIYRLSCALLMSPDAFFKLAFDSGLRRHNSPGKHAGHSIVEDLDIIIPESLERLLSAFPSARLYRSRGGDNNDWTSKLACTRNVLQLAFVFLRERCVRGYDAFFHSRKDINTARWASPHRPTLESSLASTSGGLLKVMLDPRLGYCSHIESSLCSDTGSKSTLSSAFDLLSSLLVLLGRNEAQTQQGTGKAGYAFQEAYEALSDFLVPTTLAVDTLMGWLDRAPGTLGAFLQVCVLWNTRIFISKINKTSADPRSNHLNPPFEVLGEVLSLESSRPNDAWRAMASSSILPKSQNFHMGEMCLSLLQVLAARCVAGTASMQSFSCQEVLTLQLVLQGNACDGGAILASAALEAIQALWVAYAEVLQPYELVGQPWSSFVVECCLEQSLRLMASYRNTILDNEKQQKHSILRKRNHLHLKDPEGPSADDFVLLLTIGKLLHWSLRNKTSQLQNPEVSNGDGSGLLSATAVICLYQCATLLAEHLRIEIEIGSGELIGIECSGQKGRQPRAQPPRGDCKHISSRGVVFCSVDALAQLVEVLLCIGPPSQNFIVKEDLRLKLVNKLSRLHPCLLASLEKGRLGQGCERLQQVPMTLSRGASYETKELCAFDYEDVFGIKHGIWRGVSSLTESSMWVELPVKIEKLVKRHGGMLKQTDLDRRQDHGT